MKLLISNQHGATLMALMPFLYGMLLAKPTWQHSFLFLAWFSLYLMSYPFFHLFKGKKSNFIKYQKYTLIYGTTSLIFALPVFYYNWHILYFLIAMLPFGFINIYFVKQKNERALINDSAGIIIFAIAGMASYYFSTFTFTQQIWLVALLPSLYFIGTTLYVKSCLRERKNPKYLLASYLWHVACVVLFVAIQQFYLAFAFVIPAIRAYFLPKMKISAKQLGLIEIAVALVFFIQLLFATL
ncbi:YwiC-like family protein [Histophilus somni]|uniref:YwiC-like family protein n=1 Tax=Histophilus somni TaxID=731 RepID=UPI000039763D|nr:YwiC-like family protein [Histophilus somni]ACA32681.1 conserved hypothetical protein [Histophilus somni 2336]QEH17621.1 YwiC-like family protein [Histophilus somni]QQF86675.1 YwiC-like family protein [Histophilus somni]QQJ89527.1 YwiC-like family protein [Histophilus somni]THA21869.1 hypothetical protein E5361_03465 [Histophilus somni]